MPGNDLGDVSRNMHEFLQLAEGRESITIPVPRDLKQRAKMVTLKAPEHASKLSWSLISAEGQAMRGVEEVEAQLEWRNPLGTSQSSGHNISMDRVAILYVGRNFHAPGSPSNPLGTLQLSGHKMTNMGLTG